MEDGILFPATRLEKDKEKTKKGESLTVLQFLPYGGGEAREHLRLPYAAGDFLFISKDRFLFTALYDHELEQAKKECGGDLEKALNKVKEDRESCDVMDERQGYGEQASQPPVPVRQGKDCSPDG